MKYLRGIAIDNGGSEVRVQEANKPTDEMVTYVNKYKRIDENSFRVKETENPYELVRITKAPNPKFLGIFAHGATAELYNGMAVNISTQAKKTDSLEYYIQLICDIAEDAGRNDIYQVPVEELERYKSGKKGLFDLGRSWDYVLTVVIPVAEHSGTEDRALKLKHNIAGEYEVEFPLVKSDSKVVRSFTIRPENIGVLAEGGVVVASLKNNINPEDMTVTIDMGAVSVDLALFKGTKIYGSTTITSWNAGSVLKANCRAALADAGYFLTDDAVDDAIEKGYVRQGTSEVDVSKIIKDEKERFSHNFLASDILSLLNRNGLNAKQIQNVVPVGASMNDRLSDKLGSVLFTALNTVGMTKVNVIRATDDLRYANIIAAQKFCKILLAKAVKAAGNEEAVSVAQ